VSGEQQKTLKAEGTHSRATFKASTTPRQGEHPRPVTGAYINFLDATKHLWMPACVAIIYAGFSGQVS